MTVIADLLVRIGADIAGLQAGFDTAEGKLSAFSQSATAAGASLIGMGAPLTALGAVAAKTAGDFEASMNILSVAVGGSGASLEDLRDVAMRAGADVNLVGVGAADVAVAMTNMTKAGLSTGDMLGDMQGYLTGTTQLSGALRAAIDLAAASELDLDQASQLVVTTMSTFGLTADEVVGAMNNYVQSADASVASVSDLAAAMENVGPTMAAFGFSLSDVNNALAILSTRGIAGSEAGTALKSMFTNMMRTTPEVTGALAELNINLYNTDGTMKSLSEIMGEFNRALGEGATVTQTFGGATKAQQAEIASFSTKIENLRTQIDMYNIGAKGASMTEEERRQKIAELNLQIGYYTDQQQELVAQIPKVTTSTVALTEEMRNNYVQTIAGTYGMKAMNTLLSEGMAGWNDMTVAVGDAATMQESAAAQTKGFNAAMEQLKSSVETFLIQVGTPLIQNVLTPMVQKFTELIGKLGEMDPKWVQFGIVAGGVVTALGTVLVVVGQVAGAFAALAALFGTGGALAAVGGVIAAIAAPVAAVAAAVAVLALAWNNNWFGIRDTLTGVWNNTLQPALAEIGRWLSVNIPNAIAALTGFWQNSLLPAMRDVWNFINTYLMPLFSALANAASAILGLAVKVLAGLWTNYLLPALRSVWQFIATNLEPVFKTLEQNLSGRLKVAITVIEFLFDELHKALQKIPNAISGITTWLNNLADKFRNLKLPDWLTPGSPTPLEIGLLGILDALKKVAGGPWDFLNQLMDLFGIGGGGGRSGVTINVTVSAGAVVVTGADPLKMGQMVGDAIARALQALIAAENKYGGTGGFVNPFA